MAKTSTFSKMEFPEQQMNFLEDVLGLSATDLFADDLDADGGILDLDLDGGLKHQPATHESLEDLLLTDSHTDTFGEEWMETVDFQTLMNVGTSNETVLTVAAPAVKNEKFESRPEGMKQEAFELLKALLTGQQPTKTELSIDLLQPEEPVETHAVVSPVAEVPNIDFPGCDNMDLLIVGADGNPVVHSFEDFIQPEISLDNGDVVEIQSKGGVNNTFFTTRDSVALVKDGFYENDSFGSPLSNTDVESILSSGPTSPSETYLDMSTINTSYLSDSSQSSNAKNNQVSSEDFTKLKSKSKRGKAKLTPYDSDHGNVSDKRLRKKMQNKNAATRYREKKRQEKDTFQEQEVNLSDRNKELREKVESLQREIQYMKELMNEINKAKRSKI